eukprot:GSMAST32.ASY1.ANO1.1945.1 assembled CDS
MASAMDTDQREHDVDEGLYSRQLYVMGHEAQRRMQGSDVLIAGLGGVGVEIAKNIILAGVKSVSLYDDEPSQFTDMSSQFYITEEDCRAGKSRAAACVEKLQELNQYVRVQQVSGFLEESTISQYSLLLRVNDICHSNGVYFISADIRGVFARIFCDFGKNFVVSDTSGENEARGLIRDFVTFDEVEGMVQLNNSKPRRVTVRNPYSFSIENTTNYTAHERGGYFRQVKQPKTMSFMPLRESFSCPGEFLLSDFGKMEHSPVLHLGFRALDAFCRSSGGQLPRSGCINDARKLVDIARSMNSSAKTKINDAAESILTKLSCSARGNLNPMAALIGGIAGQEVLKACSGKFTPIKQWFYFDAVELIGTRYDGQIAVFGKTLQQNIRQQSLFLVGAGAIGCEMLKNWAMMGIATSNTSCSKIYVTDMDQIEKSNLSRQFLFRSSDIGHAKSTAAARAAREMNKQMNIKAYEVRVGADTEQTFDDSFWASLSGVCTALDNVDARLYIDQRYLTENYGASRDPPEQSVPICEFKQAAENANNYITDKNAFLSSLDQANELPTLEAVLSSLVTDKPVTFAECVVWARLKFQFMFFNNQVDSHGNPFWSGTKRAPNPVVFDIDDPEHMRFIMAAANLRAFNYNLKGNKDISFFRDRLENVIVPDFTPIDGKIDSVASSKSTLPPPSKFAGYKMEPIEFEKDDEKNWHMDFITSCGNLRARNYRIKEVNKHEAKQIAGKIIPAIATTTAMGKSLEAYRNAFLNGVHHKFSIWDKVELSGPLTLSKFIESFKTRYGVNVAMISYGTAIIYSFFSSKKKIAERMPKLMEVLAPDISKVPLRRGTKYLVFEVCCVDEDDEDVDLPQVRYEIVN